jgi:hypothetical protein
MAKSQNDQNDQQNCINLNVPSPEEVRNILFSNSNSKPPVFSDNWSATALLTPFGGLDAQSPLSSSDELVVARIYYNAVRPDHRYLRVRLYLLESLLYYDFLFETNNNQTSWFWLVSDPKDPRPNQVKKAFGPYPTTVQVPTTTFLHDKGFSYIGTWKVVNRRCHGYCAAGPQNTPGTWFSFLRKSNKLSRIMNVNNTNDFNIPVLGAYYLVNFLTIKKTNKKTKWKRIKCKPTSGNAPSPMVNPQDILTAMANPPKGASQVRCRPKNIAAVIPGLHFPKSQPKAPVWTNQVHSICYMMGQDAYPYHCQLYYDYTVNKAQVTVFVSQQKPGNYDTRTDLLLPRGRRGPEFSYEWNKLKSQWQASCHIPDAGAVAMPVPNFVQAGNGRCRAVINNPYFGSRKVTIWSVELTSPRRANFWFWFNDQQQGIVFSVAPATSLTMIDYQTFVQNPSFSPSTFNDLTPSLPECKLSKAEIQKLLFTLEGSF